MNPPFIPPRTVQEMNSPHPPGTRHAAMFRIAVPLLGNGLPREAVFSTLRQKFPDPDKTDREIWDVIKWVESKKPAPSGFSSAPMDGPFQRRNGFTPPPEPAPLPQPADLVKTLPGGDLCAEEVDWIDRSPIRIEDGTPQACLLLQSLYDPDDHINVVTEFILSKDGSKANPRGAGTILTRDEWLHRLENGPAPCSEAGAWIRPNPTKAAGGGQGGAIRDTDIHHFRFVMIESDQLSLSHQLEVYRRIPLPIAALIHSGGDSVHAWLKVDARDDAQYELITNRIYGALVPYGFDPANKNPSRLSRLPGVKRIIGGQGREQRLLYLNPNPEPLDLNRIEAVCRPAPGLMPGIEMAPRMLEFIKPRPRPFTLPFMEGKDQRTFLDGFYFRESEVTLWSGVSGHGKSTMLATVMCHLMARKIPIFICSLEHRLESLCLMLLRIALGRDPNPENIERFTTLYGPLYSAADLVGSIPPERLLNMMRSAHARHGASHFFIDSLMRVEGLEEEYPRQGQFLTELTKVAMDTRGHVHLVAHPRKLDEKLRVGKMDVKGSISLSQGAFNMVAMRRNLEKDEKREKGASAYELSRIYDAEFVVEKQNASGWRGAFRLSFDPETRQFKAFNPETTPKPPVEIDEEG